MNTTRGPGSMVLIGAVALLCSLIGTHISQAATYYVAQTGNDLTTCTQAQSASTPKLTINAGLSCMQGGDTLIIKAGTYAESIEPKAIPSGTASDQTVIKAAPGEVVVIKPNNTGNSIGDAVSIYDRSYITLDGLTIDGRRLRIGGGSRKGPFSHNITFQNGIIRNTDMSCTGTQGPAGSNSHINYINNEIYNCGTIPSAAWGGEIVGHGLYIHARDSIIERNRIHHVAHTGIHLYHNKDPKAANNNIIRYNEVYSNGTSGILIASGSDNVVHDNIIRGNSGGGMMIYGQNNTEVYNNRIYDNKGDCIRIRRSANNTKLTNNACWQNTRNRTLNEGTNTNLLNNLFSDSPPGPIPPAITRPSGSEQLGDGTSLPSVQ